MMTNEIDILLIKHFMGDTTAEEAAIVAAYKQQHAAEYEAMQSFWLHDGELRPIAIDTDKAWRKVKAQMQVRKAAKRVALFARLKRVAVAASVLVMLAVGMLWAWQAYTSSQTIVVQNTGPYRVLAVQLPDGSVISLNRDASLSYPKHFEGKERCVHLSGKAFFEVARDTAHPFVVNTTAAEIRVLGTSFNVLSSAGMSSVEVASGKVRVRSHSLGQSVDLLPMQAVYVDNKEMDTYTVRSSNYFGWKTGRFVFEQASLDEVIRLLNTYYTQRIYVEGMSPDDVELKLNTCLITATFDNRSIDDVVRILELNCGVPVRYK